MLQSVYVVAHWSRAGDLNTSYPGDHQLIAQTESAGFTFLPKPEYDDERNITNYSNVHMIAKPQLYDGCLASSGAGIFAEILYADIEVRLYDALAVHIEVHELGGACRRTVWNRHFSDHHVLAVTIPICVSPS